MENEEIIKKHFQLPLARHKNRGQEILLVAFRGSSMMPTLRGSEILEVIPYHDKSIRCGDVIYFTARKGTAPLVHRVVRVRGQEIITRGDHNPAKDSLILHKDEIAGRVTTAWRGARKRVIPGGWQGRLLGGTWCGWHWLGRRLQPPLGAVYQRLCKASIFPKILPRWMHPRMAIFSTGGEQQYYLFWGRKLIGRRMNGTWRITRPFRLIVREENLSAQREKLMAEKSSKHNIDV